MYQTLLRVCEAQVVGWSQGISCLGLGGARASAFWEAARCVAGLGVTFGDLLPSALPLSFSTHIMGGGRVLI